MSLKAENISKNFGTQKALNHVSFEIQSGQIIGFLGPNGAGKSTLMKIITGFLQADEGQIFINGNNISDANSDFRSQIGYLPEHNPLYTDMYVTEYLNFTAGIYKLKNTKKRVAEVLRMTGLEIEKRKQIRELSKGFRQRVGIAAALIHNPGVLILDEPTTGLDPNQIIEIRNLILEIGKQKTVLLSTHIMQEVEAICNRVLIINSGSIVADNTLEGINKESSEKYITVSVEFLTEPNDELLKQLPGVIEIQSPQKTIRLIKSSDSADIRPLIFNFAVEQKNPILSMQLIEKSMEEIFRDLTKRAN
jgi:ABC-2 type transport system ATP-binding protein